MRTANGLFFVSVVLFLVLHNLEESSAFRRFEPTWVVFLAVAVAVARMVPAKAATRSGGAQRVRAC
jgi:hypothetical protein